MPISRALLSALWLVLFGLLPIDAALARSPNHQIGDPEAVARIRITNPAVQASLAKLRARWQGQWSPVFDRTTGFLRRLYGGRFRSRQIDPIQVARSFLSDHRPIFGSGESSSGLLCSSPAGHHVRFRQSINGVPVYGANATIHLDRDLAIRAVTSSCRSVAAPPETARLTAEQALAIATEAVAVRGALRGPSSTELFIRAYESGPRFVYRVRIPAVEPMGDWELLVDAVKGRVLEKRDLIRRLTGRGKVFDPNPVVTLRNPGLKNQNGSDSAVPAEAYREVELLDLDGSGMLRGPYADLSKSKPEPAVETKGVYSYTRSNKRLGQVMVYFHLDRAQRYIQSLGFSSVVRRPQVAIVDGTPEDNSSFSPLTKQLTLGAGGVDDSEDADTILHEYGHAILDDQVPGFADNSEGIAIGEGFADYWAAAMRPDSSYYPTLIAMWDATAYSDHSPPYLRRIDGTKRYPGDFTGDGHSDGEIWSACLRQVWQNLGSKDSDRLVLQSHYFLHPDSRFADAANALLQADRQLNEGRHVPMIRSVFVDRGILQLSGTLSVTVTNGSGKPLAAQVLVEGRPGPLTTSELTGSIEVPLPPGDYRVTVRSFGYVEKKALTVKVEADQTATLAIALEPAPLWNLSGRVLRGDTSEPVPATIALKGTPVRSLRTQGDGTFSVKVPAGTYTLVAWSLGFRPFVKADLTVQQDTTLSVSVTRLPSVLIVANDERKGYARFYQSSLTTAGLSCDTWDAGAQGAVQEEGLLGYPLVVWVTGQKSVDSFTAADQAIVRRYLESGGRMIVSGQELGFELGKTPFYRELLGARFVSDTTVARQIEGAGLSFKIEGGDGANNQLFPDVIAVADGVPGVEPYLSYSGGQGVAAVRSRPCESRLVYLAFGFEGIDTKANRDAVMKGLLSWLKPTAVDVVARISRFNRLAAQEEGSTTQADRWTQYADSYAQMAAEWILGLSDSEKSEVREFVGTRGAEFRMIRRALGTATLDR